MSGLGHLEIFFYDGTVRNSSQENLQISETNHRRDDNVDSGDVMPNWPGYGDNFSTHQVDRYRPADSDFKEKISTEILHTVCREESIEQTHLHQCANSYPTLTSRELLREHSLSKFSLPLPPLSAALDLGNEKRRNSSSHDLAAESTSACEALIEKIEVASCGDFANDRESSRNVEIPEQISQEAADQNKVITEQKLSTSLRLFPKHGSTYDASALIYFRGTSSRLAISTFLLLGRAIGMIMEQPLMTSMGSFASELMTFIADRTQCLSDHYLSTMISDDPEHLHVRRLLQVREAVWGWVHQKSCFLSSLPYHMRQLLQETRDLDKYIEIATASLITHAPRRYMNDVPHTETSHPDSETSTNSVLNSETKKVIDNDMAQVQGAAVSVQHWLQDAAEDGDEEAQYALSRWFTRPAFEESKKCHTCSNPFSISLFRHHCRCCGRSHCSLHSSQRRSLLRLGLGLISPVRVCDHCAKCVDQEVLTDILTWRRMRVEAYFASIGHQSVSTADIGKRGASSVTSVKSGEVVKGDGETKARGLILYDDNIIDRNVDKIMRVADYSLQVFKSTVSLNYPTKLVLHTVDILKRYGLSGLAGVLLRKDFMEAVETLKRISGIDHMFSLSLHELTACIYYKIAIDRGLRGCDPQGELVAHSQPPPIADSKETEGATESLDDLDDSVCEDVREDELDDIIRFAPLALSAVYEEGAADMQRLAYTQGWSTIFISAQSAPEQPAHTLFATDASVVKSSEGKRRKEAVLSVRGTASVEDIVTDIRAAPQMFPPSLEEISKALARQPRTSPYSGTSDAQADADADPYVDSGVQKDSDGWLMISIDDDVEEEEEQPYACGGMARAALWLLEQVGPALLQLHEEGYEVVLVGHSMGGAVAALLCHLLRTHLQATRPDNDGNIKGAINCRCITYGCPSSMCRKVAYDMTGFVTSVVLHDDIVSRITPESIRLLMRELLVFREQVFRHLRQDWTDVILRARDLWSPKMRVRDDVSDLLGPKQGPRPLSPSPATATATATSTYTSNSCQENNSGDSKSRNERDQAQAVDDNRDECSDAAVVVEDTERGEWIPSLWLPGRILHIYSHLGQYRVAKVPRSLPTLRKIEIQGNIFTDHVSQTIFDALLEVRAVRASDRSHANSRETLDPKGDTSTSPSPGPPAWTPYDGSALCACCSFPFTWHSTFKGEAQEYRERYNCRHCGGLICGPCSTKRRAIPRLGLMQPSRVCDKCFYKGDYAHI